MPTPELGLGGRRPGWEGAGGRRSRDKEGKEGHRGLVSGTFPGARWRGGWADGQGETDNGYLGVLLEMAHPGVGQTGAWSDAGGSERQSNWGPLQCPRPPLGHISGQAPCTEQLSWHGLGTQALSSLSSGDSAASLGKAILRPPSERTERGAWRRKV